MFRSLDFEIFILPALLNRHFEIFGNHMERSLDNQLVHAINNHLTG